MYMTSGKFDTAKMILCPAKQYCTTCMFNPKPPAPKVYWFPTGCAPYVPTFLWLINKMAAQCTTVSSHRLFMNWSDVLQCRFVHRYARTILKTYSESLFPDVSNDTNFRSLGLFWAEQASFKVKKTIWAVSAGFWRRNAHRKSFWHIQTTISQLKIGLEIWHWCH